MVQKTKISENQKKPLLNPIEKIVLITVAVILFCIYTFDVKKSNNSETVYIPSYVESISKYKDVASINLSLDVKLNERINKTELKKLGNQIYKKYNGRKYEKVFINYLIIGMMDDNGSYATTHFNPELKVVLYGLSNDDINNIKFNETLGNKYWIDDGLGVIITIKKEENQYYLYRYYRTLESDKKKLSLHIEGNETIYEVKGSTGGEYYRINNSDELELYDNNGLVYRMIKE